MHMPAPKEEHSKLHAFAGTWIGEETLFPSPWDQAGGAARGKYVSRMGLDGFFLLTDYEEERGGQVVFRGHGVYGWDQREQCYTMHWFDSMGDGAPTLARGQWEGDALTFSHKTSMGHARYVHRLLGADRYQFRLEHSSDGKEWRPMMEGTYTRQ